MISVPINVQVRHHPESNHICANGNDSKWFNFGEMGLHEAAIKFVSLISTELTLNAPVRVEIRNEHRPSILYDVKVITQMSYTVLATHPERNAIDSSIVNPGREAST